MLKNSVQTKPVLCSKQSFRSFGTTQGDQYACAFSSDKISFTLDKCPCHLPIQNMFCQVRWVKNSPTKWALWNFSLPYAHAICPDKICFVQDKLKFVRDKNFLSETKYLSMAIKLISAIHKSLKMTSFVQKLTISSGRVIFLDLHSGT